MNWFQLLEMASDHWCNTIGNIAIWQAGDLGFQVSKFQTLNLGACWRHPLETIFKT